MRRFDVNSSSGSKNSKTFKPKKHVPEGTKQYDLMQHAVATLGSGNLRLAVQLPEGEDRNEWIAVNSKLLLWNFLKKACDRYLSGGICVCLLVVDFFNQINMLYGTLTEFCTTERCPVMNAGAKYEYCWADGEKVKKPMRCSAPRYVDLLMSWTQEQLDNEAVFPSKMGAAFPRNFMQLARTILKRLFRVYAHIYYAHFQEVCALQEEAHLNTSFKHFAYFVLEFDLVEKRELAPLQELIDHLIDRDRAKQSNATGASNHAALSDMSGDPSTLSAVPPDVALLPRSSDSDPKSADDPLSHANP